MASIVSKTSVHPSSGIWTIDEVHNLLCDKSVEVMKKIVTDTTNRINSENYKKDIKLLEKGIFYPFDYFNALRETNQAPRLEWFKGKGAFFHGYVSSKYFDMVPSQDPAFLYGKKIMCFVLKQGILPSVALGSLENDLNLLACGEMCQIVQYAAVQSILGEKFNTLFAADSPTPLMIGSRLPNNPIGILRRYFMKEDFSEQDIRKGDMVYIYNASSYQQKHPLGSCRAFNAICSDHTIGSQKFSAHGFSPNGYSHKEICKDLISSCNQSYNYLDLLSDKTRALYCKAVGEEIIDRSKQMLTAEAQISNKEFSEHGGGRMTLVCDLNAEWITNLANSNAEKARALLDHYVKEPNKYNITIRTSEYTQST